MQKRQDETANSHSQRDSRLVARALRVVETIADSQEPLGVNQIGQLADIHPTTAFRILQTLCNNAWLQQNDNAKYSIGPKLYWLGTGYNFYAALREVSYYEMKSLSEQVGESVNLVVRSYEKGTIVQQVKSDRLFNLVAPPGTEIPLHATAAGKVLAADLPTPLLQQVLSVLLLERYTYCTITTKKALLAELKQVKADGYALDAQECTVGSTCVAVPVHDQRGTTLAALSVTGIMRVVPDSEIRTLVRTLQTTAESISRNLRSLTGR